MEKQIFKFHFNNLIITKILHFFNFPFFNSALHLSLKVGPACTVHSPGHKDSRSVGFFELPLRTSEIRGLTLSIFNRCNNSAMPLRDSVARFSTSLMDVHT